MPAALIRITIAALLAASQIATADQIIVDSNKDAPTLGELAGDGLCQLREAIETFHYSIPIDACSLETDSNTAVLISFSLQSQPIHLLTPLEIDHPHRELEIRGEAGLLTEITATSFHFSISEPSRVYLVNLALSDGTGPLGGSIRNSGLLGVAKSVFRNNNAIDGGAIYNDGLLDITDSHFLSNVASNKGGAIYTKGYFYPSVYRTLMEDNTATLAGGAIFSEDHIYIEVRSSLLISNDALEGCAIAGQAEYFIITNSQLSMNCSLPESAVLTGPDFSVYSANIIDNYGIGYQGSKLLAYNSIFSENAGGDCSITDPENPSTEVVFDGAWISDASCNGAAQGPAPLTTLADHGGPLPTQLPVADEGLVDAGSNGRSPGNLIYASRLTKGDSFTHDMRGVVARIINSTIDIGATEGSASQNTAPEVVGYDFPIEIPFSLSSGLEAAFQFRISDNYKPDLSHLQAGDVEVWLNGALYGEATFVVVDGDGMTTFGPSSPFLEDLIDMGEIAPVGDLPAGLPHRDAIMHVIVHVQEDTEPDISSDENTIELRMKEGGIVDFGNPPLSVATDPFITIISVTSGPGAVGGNGSGSSGGSGGGSGGTLGWMLFLILSVAARRAEMHFRRL